MRRIDFADSRTNLLFEWLKPFSGRLAGNAPAIRQLLYRHSWKFYLFHSTSLVFDYFIIMLVFQCLFVNSVDRLLQLFKVHHVILALPRVVCGGEHHEIRSEGVEHRRYCREAVAATGEIYVILSQRQQELLHIYAVARSDVRLAVIEDKKAVDEILLDVCKDILLSVTDDAPRASIRPYVVLKPRMYHGDIHPFVFMRRDD